MKVIQQDMLAVTEGILFHQVNCQGVMGGGIAYALAQKFPGLERDYHEMCKKYNFEQEQLLGKVFMWKASDKLYIANVFGQGNVSRRERMTSYDATCNAFERIRLSMDKTPSYVFAKYADRFFFPFKMGCGLGGGEWTIYSAIIAHYFPEAIVCQHNV
jgi:hypothetical protein